mmetsp:Transcript_28155/g.65789  ORF Transcript_28155/g.65789 Transcript_28155/m.65789 type:complete len:231 (-) Transcript_28155:1295-1987(-)
MQMPARSARLPGCTPSTSTPRSPRVLSTTVIPILSPFSRSIATVRVLHWMSRQLRVSDSREAACASSAPSASRSAFVASALATRRSPPAEGTCWWSSSMESASRAMLATLSSNAAATLALALLAASRRPSHSPNSAASSHLGAADDVTSPHVSPYLSAPAFSISLSLASAARISSTLASHDSLSSPSLPIDSRSACSPPPLCTRSTSAASSAGNSAFDALPSFESTACSA